MDIQELMSFGYIIFPAHAGEFALRKIPTPLSNIELLTTTFATYELAMAAAEKHHLKLSDGQEKEWVAIMRYDRGLGVEYRNLLNILAKDYAAAIELAEEKAGFILKDEPKAVIEQIKVRLSDLQEKQIG